MNKLHISGEEIVTDENKFPKKELNSLSKEIKEIDIHGISSVDMHTESAKMLEQLDEDEDFDKEVEEILSNLNEEDMDLTQLQTQIILLIKKYLHRLQEARGHKKDEIKLDEKVIEENIREVSTILMEQESEIIKKVNKDLAKSRDKYAAISKDSRNNLKRLIKNFAVYEMYKFLNPKRIAGETRRDVFTHNMIIGGLSRAKHYPGGTKNELSHYSPAFIRFLESKHNVFRSGKGMGR